MGIDYADTGPDRRPAPRKFGLSVGTIPDPFRSAIYGYEGEPERGFLTLVAAMERVVAIQEQRCVKYRWLGAWRTYTFDAVVTWDDDTRVAYAIRDSERSLLRDDTLDVLRAIREQHGTAVAHEYRVVTYASLCPAAVRNARAILRCGRDLDFIGQDAVKTALLHLGGEVALQEVADATGLGQRGLRAAVALIQSGVLAPPPGRVLTPDLSLRNRLGRARSATSNHDA